MRTHVFVLILTCFIVYKTVALAINTANPESSIPSASSNNTASSNKLHIAIYYESLCPDSMDFLTNQFAPAYDLFKNHIEVLFVPFGKSGSENNGATFYCQHGPAECTGNRLQSCALNELGDDQDAKAKFVTCQMNWNSEYTGRKCSDSSKISFANVTECKNGEKGVELQLDAEKKTHLIAKPYPSFIPTIVYNKIFNRSKNWRSLRDFKRIVCDELGSVVATSNDLKIACP